MRRQHYDISINTHPQSRIHYRIIARAVAAPIRVSHVYENFGMLDRFLVNRVILQNYAVHTAEQNLALLPLIGAKVLLNEHSLEIFLSDSDEKWADDFLASNNLAGRKILGIHAGSGGTKNLKLKRWPLENYIELLRALKEQRPEITSVLFGGPDENEEILKILEATGTPFAVQAATGNLLQAAALIKRCDGFLSVDTALMHLAAAMKARKQIVIEAPTLNETNVPYGNPFTLIENPAVHGRNLDFYRYDGNGIQGTREELEKCMSAVRPEDVLRILNVLIKVND
ncbi:MAG TPA: glycosyltransferase family 9 protein [Verrucomicrobiae bacterium]|nr:glycosyltransferase family 9 protein [Verrucomicrobiae bacterium]